MSEASKGGKSRKKGRNLKWCQAYRARAQREINKARRLIRHITRHSNDNVASQAFKNLPLIARKKYAK